MSSATRPAFNDSDTYAPGQAVLELTEHLVGHIVEDAGTTDQGQMWLVNFGGYEDTVPASLLVAEDADMPNAHDIAERFGVAIETERVTPSEVSKLPARCKGCNAHLSTHGRTPSRPKVETVPARDGGSLYRCTTCKTVLELRPQPIEYRVTLRRGGLELTTPYTRGSHWQFESADTLRAGDVLDALASDANCWEDCTDADDFLRQFCDIASADDPIKAVRDGEAAYHACGDTFKGLANLLGTKGRAALFGVDRL